MSQRSSDSFLYCICIFQKFKPFFHPICKINVMILVHENRFCAVFFQKRQSILASKYETGGGKSVRQKSAAADDRHRSQSASRGISCLRIQNMMISFSVFYEIFLIISRGGKELPAFKCQSAQISAFVVPRIS